MPEEKGKGFLIEEMEGKKLLGRIPKDRIVKVNIRRPGKEIVKEYLELDDVTGSVSDVLDHMGITKNVVPATILKPIRSGTKIAGPAITVCNQPDPVSVGLGYEKHFKFSHGADREAYHLAEPGDVVVIDGGGHDISNMGGLSALVAKAKGLAGNIVDGAVRDIDTILETGYPVWSRGHTPVTGKYRYVATSVNAPIECAGVRVVPGDFVVADSSGVAIVPGDKVEQVLELAKKWASLEDDLREVITKKGYAIEEIMAISAKRYGLIAGRV